MICNYNSLEFGVYFANNEIRKFCELNCSKQHWIDTDSLHLFYSSYTSYISWFFLILILPYPSKSFLILLIVPWKPFSDWLNVKLKDTNTRGFRLRIVQLNDIAVNCGDEKYRLYLITWQVESCWLSDLNRWRLENINWNMSDCLYFKQIKWLEDDKRLSLINSKNRVICNKASLLASNFKKKHSQFKT